MSVLLKKPFFEQISNRELAQQLEARKKCEKKLPTWFRTPKIYYPHKLNIEQTSSEITARHKAGVISGKSILDATGGLGVDSYFFSQKADRIHHCEIAEPLSEIAAHNFKVLGAGNIKCINADGLDYLKNSQTKFDWIYLDPSRRDEAKSKVFILSDCTPDVTEHLDLLFSKSDNILLKTAPLLDISMGIQELKHVKEIHVVAINNDVKEILWVLTKKNEGAIRIKTVNYTKGKQQTFDFLLDEEREAISTYSPPLTYLHEPNAAILKSGGFKILGAHLKIEKLHRHTHLYTSEKLIEFPGSVFKVVEVLSYSKKDINRLSFKTANVKTRNFPEKVADIRKKFGLKEGGPNYLFFTTDHSGKKIVLWCSKA